MGEWDKASASRELTGEPVCLTRGEGGGGDERREGVDGGNGVRE